jgi:hypothetical protein
MSSPFPPAPPYSLECTVGRLVEARLWTPRTVVEVARLAENLRRVASRLPGKCVICADWRSATLLSPEVADALVELFQRGNPLLERGAALLSPQVGSFHLQVDRAVREAGNEMRRTFLVASAMRAWLGEVLDSAERRRMNEFLIDDP